MTINKNQVEEEIKQIVNKWDISGHTCLIKDSEILSQYNYGFNDRDKKVIKNATDPYIFSWQAPFFVGLCILKLIDQKKIALNDTLDKFIPEYKYANLITINHLLKNRSGIKDYFYSVMMVELTKDSLYIALSEEEKLIKRKVFFQENQNFECVMKHISEDELEYIPGTEDEAYSSSNTPILAEIITRVSNQNIFDFLNNEIFSVLKMKTVCKGNETSNVSYCIYQDKNLLRIPPLDGDALFTMLPEDLQKLLMAFTQKKVFTKKLWKTILKFDNDNSGLVFSNANGYVSCSTNYLGFSTFLYFNAESQTAFMTTTNENQIVIYENDSWQHFRKDLREMVSTLTTYPVNTKMYSLSKKNFWSATNLSVTNEQMKFVLDARTSIAMALLYKTKKAYVQMEGSTVVGLLVLDIDTKKDNYIIDIVLVDTKFQGRGYGKKMIVFAVERLIKVGAQKLNIAVNHENIGAKKIYMNAGFEIQSVYEDGLELELTVRK